MVAFALALSAALGWGASAVFARRGLRHVRATSGTLASLMVGAAANMALALALHRADIMALGGAAFLWFLLIGTINFPVGRLLNFIGVGLAGASRASPIIGAAPLFATILAVTLTGESINLPIIVGTATIVAGIGLILSQQ